MPTLASRAYEYGRTIVEWGACRSTTALPIRSASDRWKRSGDELSTQPADSCRPELSTENAGRPANPTSSAFTSTTRRLVPTVALVCLVVVSSNMYDFCSIVRQTFDPVLMRDSCSWFSLLPWTSTNSGSGFGLIDQVLSFELIITRNPRNVDIATKVRKNTTYRNGCSFLYT